MGIWVGDKTRVCVQGITGKAGSFHTLRSIEYGTKIVAGVTPGKGGESIHGVPIFDTVQEAREATGANASIIFVPAQFCWSALKEAIDAEMEIVVCITEGIPVLDMVRIKGYLKGKKTRLIGPNSPGIITPSECRMGIMPGYIHKKGCVGVVSRSGTLTYEAVYQLTKLGIGESTCLGIGGDPVVGTSFVDALQAFERDPYTYAVVMIGEIGGTAEEEAAEFYRREMKKPVVAFIAGISAPEGKRMGHAGAIISGGKGGAAEKVEALKSAGITVVDNPATIGLTLKSVL